MLLILLSAGAPLNSTWAAGMHAQLCRKRKILIWGVQNVGVYLHTEQDHLEVQTDNETVVAVEAFLQAHQG